MLERTYDAQRCSVARALEVVGERWTLLIIRDALNGVRRFEDFQRDLGLARNILADRLQRLCAAGVLERVRYSERPERYEYRLTEVGRDLWPAVIALRNWGDRHLAPPEGKPLRLEHRHCGGEVEHRVFCADCGEGLRVWDVVRHPGPGAAPPPSTAGPVGAGTA
ncbi:MAG TPA: helix-turn-helix domain-containing protein [Candidatus Dormibacteraeota bacterium]|jgi:DNA-binding HxlR family transcriptional regulator|nr:helix-turn-helix domain-containing protein [Candidatus Dormibacteraeota bacterium]